MTLLEQTKRLAADLRLRGLLHGLEARYAEVQATGMSPIDFLRAILEDEKMHRKNVQSQKLLSKAKFRFKSDLEDFDMSYDRGLGKAKLKEVTSLGFYIDNKNLIITGKTGCGKTHLAQALGRRLCQDGVSTFFYSTNLLFEEIASEKMAGKLLAFINKASKAGVLIFDDFGLRNYSHDETMVLLDVLEARAKRGATIITSQINPKGWISLFQDPVSGEAIVDRMTKPSLSIHLDGGSYRDKLGGAS